MVDPPFSVAWPTYNHQDTKKVSRWRGHYEPGPFVADDKSRHQEAVSYEQAMGVVSVKVSADSLFCSSVWNQNQRFS